MIRQLVNNFLLRNGSGSPFLTVGVHPAPTQLSGNSVTECRYCHTLTLGQEVLSQGCWDIGDGCSTPCTLSHLPPPSLLLRPPPPALLFCCCAGEGCNREWSTVVETGQAGAGTRSRETPFLTFSITELVLMSILLIMVMLLVLLTILLTR